MLQKERDRLQERLDKITEEYDQKIAVLKATYEQAIADLETKQRRQREADQAQLDEMYRRMYRVAPPPPTI
jgi:hypothetical protein